VPPRRRRKLFLWPLKRLDVRRRARQLRRGDRI